MLKSILDIEVSCFENYTTSNNPKNVNLLTWLKSEKHKNKVEEIRKISDKEKRDIVKSTLPVITPSGTFTKRNAESLIMHSGFIQFDVDLKGNENIANYTKLKQQLSNIKNVAYCGLSVSGRGYWGLIPIAFPEKHKEHFKAMEKAFKDNGIIIDPLPKNVASSRGYSYDQDGYFNHCAQIFKKLHIERQQIIYKSNNNISRSNTLNKVELCIKEMEKGNIDVAPDYETYRNIGFAFANEFGENGRSLFHSVCSPSSKYIFDNTEKHYTGFLKSRGKGINIGSFFHYCKQANVSIN